jgi:iron complex transport system ATP-binding protein
MLTIIRDLARSGRTILMTTHQPDHALVCGDRAVLMAAGSVVADGPPDEVVTGPRLSELYGVDVHVLRASPPEQPDIEYRTCVPVLNQYVATR